MGRIPFPKISDDRNDVQHPFFGRDCCCTLLHNVVAFEAVEIPEIPGESECVLAKWWWWLRVVHGVVFVLAVSDSIPRCCGNRRNLSVRNCVLCDCY